jgi:hypothetical protein
MGALSIGVVTENEAGTFLSVKGTATTFRFVGRNDADA